MQEFNILALIQAGAIKETDDVLPLLQNVSDQQAHQIALWLTLATRTTVNLRLIGIGGAEEIHMTPHDADMLIELSRTAQETRSDAN